MKQLTISLLIFISSISIATANDDKDNIVFKLAQCSGVYEIASELFTVTGTPDLAKSTKESSNGAVIASAWLVSRSGIIKDWQKALQYSNETAQTEKNRWAGMLEVNKHTPDQIILELTDEMDDCNTLSDIQAEAVQQARLWAYSQSE